MEPSVRLLAITTPVEDIDYEEDGIDRQLRTPLDLIEFAGRWDYGANSVAKMKTEDNNSIIARWLQAGEESMVEMVSAVFMITCSRVVTHELVRHRLASYQQESQRFVSYKDEHPEYLFILPPELMGNIEADGLFQQALIKAKDVYVRLVELGVPKQIARYVLPNATRTRIIVAMNLREWRHVLRLRLHTSAQPEMRQVMAMVHKKLQREFGDVLFPDGIADERAAR